LIIVLIIDIDSHADFIIDIIIDYATPLLITPLRHYYAIDYYYYYAIDAIDYLFFDITPR
jgi:hypothetical protein